MSNTKRMKTKFICNECGSDDLYFDADLKWDSDADDFYYFAERPDDFGYVGKCHGENNQGDTKIWGEYTAVEFEDKEFRCKVCIDNGQDGDRLMYEVWYDYNTKQYLGDTEFGTWCADCDDYISEIIEV